MKFDSLDLKIVRMLQKDGRRPFAEIARELSVPAGVVQARFAKMTKAGLIKGFALKINPYKIGMVACVIMTIRAVESEVEEVTRYINGLTKIENTMFDAYAIIGHWNVILFTTVKDLDKANKIRNLVRLHPAVMDVNVRITKELYVWADEKLSIERIFKE